MKINAEQIYRNELFLQGSGKVFLWELLFQEILSASSIQLGYLKTDAAEPRNGVLCGVYIGYSALTMKAVCFTSGAAGISIGFRVIGFIFSTFTKTLPFA